MTFFTAEHLQNGLLNYRWSNLVTCRDEKQANASKWCQLSMLSKLAMQRSLSQCPYIPRDITILQIDKEIIVRYGRHQINRRYASLFSNFLFLLSQLIPIIGLPPDASNIVLRRLSTTMLIRLEITVLDDWRRYEPNRPVAVSIGAWKSNCSSGTSSPRLTNVILSPKLRSKSGLKRGHKQLSSYYILIDFIECRSKHNFIANALF